MSDQRPFYLITASDSDVRVRMLSEAGILVHLDAGEDGTLTSRPYEWDEGWDPDPAYWQADRCLIIRGEVVTAKPVTVRYELR